MTITREQLDLLDHIDWVNVRTGWRHIDDRDLTDAECRILSPLTAADLSDYATRQRALADQALARVVELERYT